MKKKLLLCVLAAAMILAGGCGKNEKEEQKMPEYSKYIDELADYKNLTFEEKDVEPTQDQINEQLDAIRSYCGTETPVTDRAVKKGDKVNLDYVGSTADGPIEGGSTLDVEGNYTGYDLTIGSGKFIPGFEDQIIGHKIGDQFKVEVTFPENYKNNPDLSGAPATFDCRINAISEVTYPDKLTDEDVKKVTDYNTVEELNDAIYDKIKETNEDDAEDEYKKELLDSVIQNTKFNGIDQDTYDEFFKECKDTDQGYADQLDYASLLDYVDALYGYKTMEEYEAGLAEKCEYYTKKKMVIYEIAKQENLTISEAALNNYEDELVSKYGYESKEKMLEKNDENRIKYDFIADRVYSLIYKNASPAK